VPANERSGVIGSGHGFPEITLEILGCPGMPVKLLDGCLLAAHSETLISRNLRFDERFRFHFHDADFCRSAERLGLRLGTCRLSAVHRGGARGGNDWKDGYARYLEKWGD